MSGALVPRLDKAIHQFSFIDALVAGLLDGAFAASRVRASGDFGLGCGDALDGEMLYLDSRMVLCRGDGHVVEVDDDALLPFAEVTIFEPTYSESLVGPMAESEFEAHLASIVPSENLFYAVRVDGDFSSMTVREAVRQQQPYPGLADAVKSQHENSVGSTSGSMIGFVGPDVFQGLSVADVHLHYLDAAGRFGGHVMDFDLTKAMLSIEAYATFTLHLPEVASYLRAELDDIEADEAIRQAESS